MNTLRKLAGRIVRAGIPVTVVTRPLFSSFYVLHVFLRESGIWALRFFYCEPLFKSQCRKVGKGLWMEKLPYLINSGIIEIGDNVQLSGKPSFAFSSKLYPDPAITIGNRTFIGHQTSFAIGKSIVIGDDCFIAGGVRISDNDGHPVNAEDRKNHLPPRREDVREVRIGNSVWIGGHATILKGVTIGDRSVVGASAVVTKDVPPDTVVVGNPARIVKTLEIFPQKQSGQKKPVS
jgi:acetyltransferase-like isoleucine patch superfamily enzyme